MNKIFLDPITKRFIDTGEPNPNPNRDETIRKIIAANHIKPNKAELRLQVILDKYFPTEWKYVGSGLLIIDGKCPDFTNINGKKELIELFGSYWHTLNEVSPRIEHFSRFGYTCLIIWEEELDNEDDLIRHINSGDLYIPKYSGNHYEGNVLSNEDIRFRENFRELKAELKACIENRYEGKRREIKILLKQKIIFPHKERVVLDVVTKQFKVINYKDLIEPHVKLMASLALMLMRATFVQEDYPIEPKKPRGRPRSNRKEEKLKSRLRRDGL